MKTAELKQKLHDYIDTAEQKKLKAIYTILQSDIEDGSYDWEKDEEWLAELDRRQADALNPDVKKYTLEETVDFAMQSLKKVAAGEK